VALVDQQIVGYEWFCEQALHQETAWGLPITIPDGFVYAYDAYVNPAFRNSGVWLRFKAYLGDWMSETGKLGVLTFVESGNLPSLNTHLRFGFRPAERVLAVKIMGLKVFRTLRTVGTASALSLLSLLLARGPLLSRPVHLGLQVIRCVAAARLR
jgi:GNAT superfamily N-acetyltransferase